MSSKERKVMMTEEVSIGPRAALDELFQELDYRIAVFDTQIDFWIRRTEAELGAMMLRNQIRANITFDPLFLHCD